MAAGPSSADGGSTGYVRRQAIFSSLARRRAALFRDCQPGPPLGV